MAAVYPARFTTKVCRLLTGVDIPRRRAAVGPQRGRERPSVMAYDPDLCSTAQ